jgi:hypothetical protein
VNNRRPVRSLMLAVCLLGVALAPTAVATMLDVIGMDGRAARIAGSRLTVMSALCGAGLLFISIARWARASRLGRISLLHAQLLDHLSAEAGGRAVVTDESGAHVTGEFDGLRTEIHVSPEQGGEVRIRALCMPGRIVVVWPRGLGLGEEMPGLSLVSKGAHWEAWSAHREPVLVGAESALEEAFGEGGMTRVIHDADGIELILSNGPPELLLGRLRIAVRLASSLARINR